MAKRTGKADAPATCDVGKSVRVLDKKAHRSLRRRSEVLDVDPADPSGQKPLLISAGGEVYGTRPIPEDTRKMFTMLVPECVATLAELMRNGKSEKTRIDAANAIIAYGYGKPESVTKIKMDANLAQDVRTAAIVRSVLLEKARREAMNTIDVESSPAEEQAEEDE